MSKYKVDITGINTSSLTVLSNEEQIELFKKYQKGDKSAKDKLVNGNLKLVLSILKKYNNRCENMDDLFQVGVIGLIKAIDNFDLSYDLKLSTYACPLILGEVRRYLRDNSSIRVSRSLKDLAYRILKCREELTNSNGIEPDLEQIAVVLGEKYFDCVSAIEAMKDPVSMFEPIYSDGGDTIFLCDQIADTRNSKYELETRMSIDNAINDLRDRERFILDERFVIGKTQMEVAEELSISQAQVSRLEKNAIKTLKKVLKGK